MTTWKVFLKFSNGAIQKLELIDAKPYFGGYLRIKRSYFNALAKTIKMTKKYFTERAIERVISPDEIDWTLNPWMLIIVKDNEKKIAFWFFIKREKDLSGNLVAIGPKPFADYNNKNLSEAKRDIKRLINYIIAYLNKFNCLILLPNYLK
ncbi:hypothetical protein LCGC14_0498970 [marine sediment metagenome]|uniref:Uncharacterized protein n=1 Tax=marine sediment metagenome TaxID=412755 RepID=A0A0F9SN00_9ZZZZ